MTVTPPERDLQAMVRIAMQDAARITGLAEARLKLIDAEAVTWRDGAVGCPQPDRMYAQALVPGYLIRIQTGAEVLHYHASQRGAPFLCPRERAQAPSRDAMR